MNKKRRNSGKTEKGNFFTSNYKECWKFLKESSDYIVVALSIFCIFAIIGFALPIFFQEQILRILQDMAKRFEGLGVFQTIVGIFFNNLFASIMIMVLGIGFGIFALFQIIFNGYVLGFVARIVSEQEGISILWRLLPHGIFELPAIILSMGVGLKLGVNLFHKNRWKLLGKDFRESIRFFFFIVLPLLLIAAIIEGILVVLIG